MVNYSYPALKLELSNIKEGYSLPEHFLHTTMPKLREHQSGSKTQREKRTHNQNLLRKDR